LIERREGNLAPPKNVEIVLVFQLTVTYSIDIHHFARSLLRYHMGHHNLCAWRPAAHILATGS
jgi:hypothetical protein